MKWAQPEIFDEEVDLGEMTPAVRDLWESNCWEFVFGREGWVRAMFLNTYYMMHEEVVRYYGNLEDRGLDGLRDLIESTNIYLYSNQSDFLFYRRIFDCLMCMVFGTQTYFDFINPIRLHQDTAAVPMEFLE